MGLEDKLIQTIERGEDFDTAEALLVASGIDSESDIVTYKEKLHQIASDFSTELRSQLGGTLFDELEEKHPRLSRDSEALMGYKLHNYFFDNKPKRYNSNYLFQEVIDAQLSDSERVGNCVGLVSLFHIVGSIIGIKTVPVLTSEHIYLQQETDKGNKIIIETTLPEGYDYKKDDEGKVGDKINMVCSIYNSRVIHSEDKGERNRLIEVWQKINSKDPQFHAYRAMDFFEAEDFENAEIHFRKAIDLNMSGATYFAGYAGCLFQKGDMENATFFAEHALKLKPDLQYAHDLLTDINQ
jgi:tetratricopeptide (TPR) repeat protein